MPRPEERRREAPELRRRLRRPLEIRVNRQPATQVNLRRAIRLRRLRGMQRPDRARRIRIHPTAPRNLRRIPTTRIIRIRTRTIRILRRIIPTPARTRVEFRLLRIRLRLRAPRIQVRQILVQTLVRQIQGLRILARRIPAVALLLPHAVKSFFVLEYLRTRFFGSAFLLE